MLSDNGRKRRGVGAGYKFKAVSKPSNMVRIKWCVHVSGRYLEQCTHIDK